MNLCLVLQVVFVVTEGNLVWQRTMVRMVSRLEHTTEHYTQTHEATLFVNYASDNDANVDGQATRETVIILDSWRFLSAPRPVSGWSPVEDDTILRQIESVCGMLSHMNSMYYEMKLTWCRWWLRSWTQK